MRITQAVVVGGPKHLAGHVGQEVKETVDALFKVSPEKSVLVPSRDTATGFRPMALEDRHVGAGFVIEQGKANEVIAPAPELLAAFKGIASRRAFVPEIYSHVLDRNMRFMVSLPPNFDAAKASEYPVVHVLPGTQTMAWYLAEGGLNGKLESTLRARGLPDAIVVVAERFERTVSDAVNAKGKAALGEVQGYLMTAFGAAPKIDATLVLPELASYQASIAAPVQHEDRRGFVADQHAMRTEEKPRQNWFGSMLSIFLGADNAPSSSNRSSDFGSSTVDKSDKGDKSFFKKPSWDGAIVVATGDRPKVTQASSWDGKVKLGKLPDASFFEPLRERSSAGIAVAALASKIADGSVPYAAIVPKGFDPKKHYPVEIVHADADFAKIVSKLGEAQLDIADRIVLVVDAKAFEKASKKDPSALASHAKYELLAAVSDQLPIDLGRVHDARSLGGDAEQWVARVQIASTSPARSAGGPVVFSEGQWVHAAPTLDHERSFPRLGFGVKGDSAIPREMQKQPADHGTMFVPVIDSKAVDKPFRAGVYLPPGYDPASSEKLPVLVMLPGKGGALEQWTSAGSITPKLDELMRGNGQKMIVVIPDKTDSLWFDYDKNGEPSVGDKGKRNYEGLLMDEILPFVTKTLNADPDRLSIAGISRGGFGAMSLAARHPGKFNAVSAHSAVLALEHKGGELGKLAAGEMSKHLGPEGHPVWSQVNPLDLVASGKLGNKPPRVLVDIGADDPYFVDDNLAFGRALADAKVPHELKVYGGDTDKKHNWDTWATLFPSWIAFHQETFGKAGDVKLKGVVDLTADVTKERGEARAKLEKELAGRIDTMARQIPSLTSDDRAHEVISYSESKRYVHRPLAALQEGIDGVKRDLQTLEGKPLHVLEARVGPLEGRVSELQMRLERGRSSLIGVTPAPVQAAPGALEKLPGNVLADLKAAMSAVPELAKPLAKLATVRPGVFIGNDDMTGVNFAKQLREFVTSDVFDAKKDSRGMAEFIERMAERRYDWRRGGFSNAVTATMNTIFNHPGIVLTLTTASRRDQALEFPAFYAGDPATKLRPMGDFKAAFSNVSGTDSSFGHLPSADLGYERAILRMVRDELCPPKDSMPDTRAFGQRTNMPVAEGLAKLRGREVLYGYAMKIKTGQDLVDAVLSQGKEGLAMSDMKLGYNGKLQGLHFPVFYDYDPKTRTIEMQHWGAGPVRLKIDGLQLDDVGVYFENTPGMQKFLTPEKQGNWDAIRRARDKAAEALNPRRPIDAKEPKAERPKDD